MFKSFRSLVKEKHSANKNFESLVVRGKQNLLITSRTYDKKIMKPIIIAAETTTTIRK